MYVLRSLSLASLLVLAVTPGCGSTADTDSELNVINGRTVDENEHPAVFYLGHCTATFVSDSTLITAGHCVKPGGSVTLRKRSNVSSIKIIRNPAYGGVGRDDVAVVLFPAGTASTWLPVQKVRVAPNDDVLLVGYGCTLSTGKGGIKRIGTNTIVSSASGTIMLRRNATSPESGSEATLCPGDSGGPLLKANTLVGIASFWDGGAGRSSGHADLTHPANQDFLQRTIAEHGAKINFTSGENGSGQADLYLALGSPAGDAAKVVASAPTSAVKMRVCKVAQATDACDAGAAGSLDSSVRRTVGDRAVFSFDSSVTIGARAILVLVALDASGNTLGRDVVSVE